VKKLALMMTLFLFAALLVALCFSCTESTSSSETEPDASTDTDTDTDADADADGGADGSVSDFGDSCTGADDDSCEGVCHEFGDGWLCTVTCDPGDASTCPEGSDGKKKCNDQGVCRP
jgi:hypothetical protein